MAKCITHHNLSVPVKPKRQRGEVLRFLQAVVLPWRESDCLIWPFSVDARGYPQVGFGKKNYRVHRLACEERCGPAPSDRHDAAHSCGNRRCVNPTHMRWATRKENMEDTLRHNTRVRGERINGARLSEDQVRAIRSMIGSKTQTRIAALFGVSVPTITDIKKRKSWHWLD